MNIQVTASHSDLKVSKVFNSHSRSSVPCVAPPDFCILRTKALKLTINGAPIYQRRILPDSYLRSRYQRCPPVCFFGGKGRSKNDDEASPWKSIEKGFGNLKKEQSVEDALRKQIEKQEYDDGGSDGNRSGGSGGRGGGRGGSGGSGDESSREFWDEQLQVVLATAGLIFVYFYLIIGDNWPKLARDYIKALFGMGTSYRVRANMELWANFYQKLAKVWDSYLLTLVPTPDNYDLDELLARKICDTQTWFDVPMLYDFFRPEFYNKLIRPKKVKTRRLKSKKDEDEDEDEDKDEVDVRTSFSDDSDKEVDDKAESEDDSLFGDDYIDFEKEFGDVSVSDKGVEKENSKEEDSDPFESYLIDDDNEGKEEEEDEEEKDFFSYLNKIDMAKAKTLLSDSSDEEEENYRGPGTLHHYIIDLYGPNVEYVDGPLKLVRRPKKKKKKKTRKQKDKKDNRKKASKV